METAAYASIGVLTLLQLFFAWDVAQLCAHSLKRFGVPRAPLLRGPHAFLLLISWGVLWGLYLIAPSAIVLGIWKATLPSYDTSAFGKAWSLGAMFGAVLRVLYERWGRRAAERALRKTGAGARHEL